MTDTLEVVGKVSGIEQRQGGWRRVLVEVPGNKYPVKVDTKKEEIIAQATEALEWPAATVRYTEKDSGNENPHRPGENYLNRYLEAVLPVTPADEAKHAEAKKADTYWKPRDPGETRSIVRQSCLKTAFGYGAYKYAGAKDESDRARLEIYLLALAERMEAWITRPTEEPVASEEPPPLTDADAPVLEDVPFE